MPVGSSDMILVVDDDAIFRDALRRQLSQQGLACVTAASYEAALRTIRQTPGLSCVVFDNIGGPLRLVDVVREVRRLRPDLTLVGNSGSDRRREFAEAGITEYFQKPWPAQELRFVLRGAIRQCVDCELPLPLRRVGPGEDGQTWVCAGCGSRYYAVLDELAPHERRWNVRIERPLHED